MPIPALSPRRLTGLAAIACAAALAPAAALAAAPSPAATTATAAPHCQTSRLVIWMDTPGSGAAGSVFYTVMFTNLSGHACTLDGHPVMAAGLRIRPPGQTASKIVPIPLKACTTGVTYLNVRPIQRTPPAG